MRLLGDGWYQKPLWQNDSVLSGLPDIDVCLTKEIDLVSTYCHSVVNRVVGDRRIMDELAVRVPASLSVIMRIQFKMPPHGPGRCIEIASYA